MSDSYKQKTAYDGKNCDRFFLESGINHFGVRLKEAMKRRGIKSNVVMAAMCDMSDTVIRNYVSGKTYPTLDRLAILACVLECTPEWLLTGDSANINSVIEERKDTHRDTVGNNSSLEVILKKLSHKQQDALVEAILDHGVNGILSALGDIEVIAEFSRLPDAEKERLMRLHEEIKKGSREGTADTTSDDLDNNHQQAV
ncbi:MULTISPECIES: helix-turn-helix domain-containing protein [Serratia]|uniref:helix-turn-helix domain-containing protein n=1 Tax=Serratia TaxID=613 RepID=UPI00069D6E32|nr:helix-turn-helix domain-containing protein [Serratia sp. 506_PEND]